MADPGEWLYVGEEGGPPLENGRIMPDQPLRFRRIESDEDGVGHVQIAGGVEFGPVFTLPEGYRPTVTTLVTTLVDKDGRIWCRYVATAKGQEPLGPKTPDWAGPDPIIEPTTFGQGSFGHRCRLCGARDYAGPLKHRPGCPGAEA